MDVKGAKTKNKRTIKQRRYLSYNQRMAHTSDEAIDTDASIPLEVRNRLHSLFGEIEVQNKVDELSERLENANALLLVAGVNVDCELSTTSTLQESQQQQQQVAIPPPATHHHAPAVTRHQSIAGTLVSNHGGKKISSTSADHNDYAFGRIPKFRNFESASSHISQRLKQSYKQSTNRIVSSFRNERADNHVVREFKGHTDGVWEVNVCPTEPNIIGTASLDKTARLWCVNSGVCMLAYSGHQGSVNSVRFHPGIDVVMTTGGDRQCHLWKPEFEQRTLSAMHRNIREPCQSSGEDEVEVSDKEEINADLDLEPKTITRPNIKLEGHTDVVIAADWLASGHQVITASWDHLARLYDVETGELVDTLSGHEEELTNVVCHLSQRMALTSSRDHTFRLWDVRDASMSVNVFQGHQKQVTTAIFNGSNMVISASDDQFTKIWDLRNMSKCSCTIASNASINRLSVSKQMNIIALPLDNKHINLYNINGIRIARLPHKKQQGHSGQVYSTAWREAATTNISPSCNLFSVGMDHRVIGWHVEINSKE